MHQRNRGIHFQSGFFGSFDAPWSERSWIDLCRKETQNPFSAYSLNSDFSKKRTLSLLLCEASRQKCQAKVVKTEASIFSLAPFSFPSLDRSTSRTLIPQHKFYLYSAIPGMFHLARFFACISPLFPSAWPHGGVLFRLLSLVLTCSSSCNCTVLFGLLKTNYAIDCWHKIRN